MRSKVERSFAWLGNFRRLLIRWEHLAGMYASFFTYAMMRLCVVRLCRSLTLRWGRGGGGVVVRPPIGTTRHLH